jgi:hypothetical protein
VMQKLKQYTPVWCPPFSDSPDPAVRRAWADFAARKGDSPYSMGDAIAYMERRIPQRAGGSSDANQHGPLGIGLTRWLRELRA